MTSRKRSLSGMTLVEVLIAATILFAAIAVSTEAYVSTLRVDRKATSIATLLTPMPFILAQIQQEIRSNPLPELKGGGEFLGVDFNYVATSKAFAGPAKRFDPDVGRVLSYPPKFRLYEVTLTLSVDRHSRVYRYEELAWNALP